MSTYMRITLPSGERRMIYFRKGQDKRAIIENVILPHWKDYCERHWQTDDCAGVWTPEARVKRFLDDCAYLLLRDNPEGTLTTYKDLVYGSTEIDVSSCPASMYDDLFSSAAMLPEDEESDWFNLMLESRDEKIPPSQRKKESKVAKKNKEKAPPSTFEKAEKLRREYPGSFFEFVGIDTENIFAFRGEEYRLDDSVEQYQPTMTREGLYYPMDQVLILTTTGGEIQFYDQRFDRIDDYLVWKRNAPEDVD